VAELTDMLNVIEEYLQLKRYKYERFDGSCEVLRRDFRFLKDFTTFVFLSRFVSVTHLTAAHIVIVSESDCNVREALKKAQNIEGVY